MKGVYPRTEATRRRMRESAAKRWNNPEQRVKASLATKKYFDAPGTREKASIAHKKYYQQNPDAIEKNRNGQIERFKTPMEIEKRRETQTRLWQDPTYREAHCGENHFNWHGGISFEPYCPLWTKSLRTRIRAFFDNKCVMCGRTTNTRGANMSCHHVKYDKSACCDGKPVHFVALCCKCHPKTNYDRPHWEAMFHRCIDEIWGGRSYYTKDEYAEICKQRPEEDARP